MKVLKYLDNYFVMKKNGNFANKRVALLSEKPENCIEINLNLTVDKMVKLAQRINNQFVGLNDLSNALLLSLMTGENAYVVGLPGNGKTALMQMFSEAFFPNESFFLSTTPTTTLNEILGGIDLGKLMTEKIWSRRKIALQISKHAIFDELDKANSSIRNGLLQILEENSFSENGNEIPLNIAGFFVSTNKVISEQAVIDRFGIRLKLREKEFTSEDVFNIVRLNSCQPAIENNIDFDEIILVQAAVEFLSKQEDEFINTMIAHTKIQLSNQLFISNRRIFAWRKLISAYQLLSSGFDKENMLFQTAKLSLCDLNNLEKSENLLNQVIYQSQDMIYEIQEIIKEAEKILNKKSSFEEKNSILLKLINISGENNKIPISDTSINLVSLINVLKTEILESMN